MAAITEVFADFQIKLDVDRLVKGQEATKGVTEALTRGAAGADKFAAQFRGIQESFARFAAAGIQVTQRTRDAALQLNNLGARADMSAQKVQMLAERHKVLSMQLSAAKNHALTVAAAHGAESAQALKAAAAVRALELQLRRVGMSQQQAQLGSVQASSAFQRQREKVLELTKALQIQSQANQVGEMRATRFGLGVKKTAKEFTKPDGLLTSLDRARGSGEGFFATMAKFRRIFGLIQFGAFVFGLKNFINATLQAADAVGKGAARLGVTTDAYQQLTAVAETAGARTEDVERAMNALSRSTTRAARGVKEQARLYKELGVELTETNGQMKDQITLLVEVGNKLGQMEDVTKRNAYVQDALGQAGAKLLPAFANTTASIEEQIRAYRDLAVVYDESFIKRVEEANDNMTFFGRAMQRIKVQIVNEFVPSLNSMAVRFIRSADALTQLLKTTKTVQAALALGLGMAVLSLVGRLGMLLRILKMLRVFLWKVLIPFLIIEDIFVFLAGGSSALGAAIDKVFGEGASTSALEGVKKLWIDIKEIVGEVWEAIKGVFGGDSEDATLDLQLAWERLVVWIKAKLAMLWFWMKDEGAAMMGLLVDAAIHEWNTFWFNFPRQALAAIEKAKTWMVKTLREVGPPLLETLRTALANLVPFILQLVDDFIAAWPAAAAATWEILKALFVGVFAVAWELIKLTWQIFVTVAEALIPAAFEILGKLIAGAGSALAGIWDLFLGAAASAIKTAGSWIKKLTFGLFEGGSAPSGVAAGASAPTGSNLAAPVPGSVGRDKAPTVINQTINVDTDINGSGPGLAKEVANIKSYTQAAVGQSTRQILDGLGG
jgi:hypothetical protein